MVNPNFANQYNEIYQARLTQLRDIISKKEINNLKKISEIDGECTVIGVLFLCSSAKHSILDTFRDIDFENKDNKTTSYLNDTSKYMIEDETGKVFVKITDKSLPVLISGMVLGFTGKMEGDIFLCKNIIFPPFLENNENNEEGIENDCMNNILILNNILINDNFDKLISLIYYCSDKINDIILIGDIGGYKIDKLYHITKYLNSRIFMVPGQNDPTPQMLPQMPFHKKLYNLLKNPTDMKNKNNDFVERLGNPEDVQRYSKDELKGIDILEILVKTRHIAPNAPDTISCIPYEKSDPFVVKNLDFLISGFGNKADYKNVNGITIVTVPDFNATNEGVILNIKEKKIEVLKIN